MRCEGGWKVRRSETFLMIDLIASLVIDLSDQRLTVYDENQQWCG